MSRKGSSKICGRYSFDGYVPERSDTNKEFVVYVNSFFPEISKLVDIKDSGMTYADYLKMVDVTRYPYYLKSSFPKSLPDYNVRLLKAWMFVNKHMYAYWAL